MLINATGPWIRRIFPCLIAAGLCTAVYWLAPLIKKVRATDNDLDVDPRALELGELWEERGAQCTLPIENRSGKEVTIASFGVSCNCVSIEPSSATIPAGQIAQVNLALNLFSRNPKDPETVVLRDFTVMISPRTELTSRPPIWTIHAKVRSAISLKPRIVDLEERVWASATYESEVVTVSTHVPLKALECTERNSMLDVRSARDPSDPSRFRLSISPLKTLREGSFETEVFVKPVPLNGPALPPVPLRVRGRMVQDVRPIPSSLNLGACRLGVTKAETLTIRTISGKPLRIQAVSAMPGVIIIPLENASSGEAAYTVRATISGIGDQKRIVSFLIQVHDRPPFRLEYPVTYFGQAAQTKARSDSPLN